MRKYFLGKTNREVKLGSTISVRENVNTSFGFNEVSFVVTLSKKNVKKLIDGGIIRVKDDKEVSVEEKFKGLRPCIHRIFGKASFIKESSTGKFLEALARISPKARLQLLIENFAEIRNKNKKIGDCTWYLNPIAGYAPIKIMGKPSSTMVATVFYDEQDAKEVYSLLSDFINAVIDGK